VLATIGIVLAAACAALFGRNLVRERNAGSSSPLVSLAKEWSAVDPSSLPTGQPSLVTNRKVAVVFRGGGIEEYLHKHPSGPVAGNRSEVGVIISIEGQPDAVPTTYATGARSFGTRFRFTAIAIPERVVVGRWERYEASSKTTPMIQGKGYQTTAGSGTTIYAGLRSDDILDDAKTLVGGAVPAGNSR
jgi:hypothetical protein